MPPLYLKVWIWILLNVDEETGSVRTSLDKIAADIAWDERNGYRRPTRKTISHVISELEVVNSISTEVVYRSFTRITVMHWADYQTTSVGGIQTKHQRSDTTPTHLDVDVEVQDVLGSVVEQNQSSVVPSIKTCMSDKDSKQPPLSAAVPVKESVKDERIEKLFGVYVKYVHPGARLTLSGRKKITSRLKEYSPTELQMAILNFARDSWQMENNSYRGAVWFFHSEDRIQQFIALQNKKPKSVDADLGISSKEDFIKRHGGKVNASR